MYPVHERPVPQSDVPGEQAWPTQPFPTLPAPVARQQVRVEDLTEFPDPRERQAIRERLLAARHEGIFTPPSLRGTISVPGHHGGPLWGGGAFDPQTGMFYVTSHDQPSYLKLSPLRRRHRRRQRRGRRPGGAAPDRPVDVLPGQRQAAGDQAALGPDDRHRPQHRQDRLGVAGGRRSPASPPGAVPPTGHKYLRGGPVVTAGGLVFMAGTQDRSLRAFDKRTGALLWTGRLPFDSVAIPAIYEVRRQAVRGHHRHGRPGSQPRRRGGGLHLAGLISAL